MGQFRTADGLVLLSGRMLGPQIFLPLAYRAKAAVAQEGENRPLSLRIG